MTIRTASCPCGRARATCTGEPIRVSACHCLDCQKRSGSVFAVQARWPDAQVKLTGDLREWSRTSDSGSRITFRFCARCGTTIAYAADGIPGITAIPVGGFADPAFPAPTYSVYEERQHPWLALIDDHIEHID